jgi:iron(III) transport system permease protein
LLYPYIVPPFITAIGWVVLANPKVGLLTSWIPGINIYTMEGLVFVETLYWYTYVLLNVMNVLENMDGSLEESARMCGAGPVRIFRTVTLPLLTPTLVASGLIVFLCTISSFGVPAIIGNPGKVYVLTTTIISLIRSAELNQAMTLSLPVIVFAFGLIYFSETWFGKKAYATLTGKHNRKLEINLRAWRWPVLIAFLAFAFMAIVLPCGTIFLNSLLPHYGKWDVFYDLSGLGSGDGLSLVLAYFKRLFANYIVVLSGPIYLESIKNSFGLAFGGAILLTVLSFFIAYFKEKTRYRFTKLLSTLSTLPYATPGTVLALAIYSSFIGYDPLPLLMLAYVAKYLSHGVKVMAPAIINVDKSLEEAALMCGAKWGRTLTSVWLPLLKGTISTSIFLMAAPLFSELTMSVLLADDTFPTIGQKLFKLQEYENPTHALVLSVVILIFIVGLNRTVKKLSRGRLGV